jgi:cobalamin-dependent methionine synthase I
MKIGTFIIVCENIHCTRIYKVGGSFVQESGGGFAVQYRNANGPAELPVPEEFTKRAEWEQGKVKHCAVAIWQGNHGDAAARAAGVDYLQSLARRQEAMGAAYLDINVDEYSTDLDERLKMMRWTVDVVQQAVKIPMSIDSSNADVLKAGLECCDKGRGAPMVNSVSLERQDAIAVAAEHGAVVIASAAGETGMPANTDERMANLQRLMPMLHDAGLKDGAVHVDPLVFPISVDGNNGRGFLDAVKRTREAWGPAIHIVAGLSNVSFGMPNRKLINQVFTYMALQHGADGGIVDPMQLNKKVLEALDPEDAAFKLAENLLTGADEYGMEYITAAREGTL